MPAGTYTTKYQNGGSGDNIVPDGYIKATEKVWIDSYTIDFTSTNSTIDIAVLTPNKKIIGVDLMISTSVTQTNGTISVGFSTDANVDTLLNPVTLTQNLTMTTINLFGGHLQSSTNAAIVFGKITGFQFVTGGTQTTVSIKLNNWTMTSGTVKTVVRYT